MLKLLPLDIVAFFCYDRGNIRKRRKKLTITSAMQMALTKKRYEWKIEYHYENGSLICPKLISVFNKNVKLVINLLNNTAEIYRTNNRKESYVFELFNQEVLEDLLKNI